MFIYYGIYSLLVALWVLKDASFRNMSRWWALGIFLLPILFPYYIVKTRQSNLYWKHISLWLLGFFIFHTIGIAINKIDTNNNPDKSLSQTTEWNKFVSPDDQFSVNFPTHPKRESDIVNTPDGKAELIQYMSKKGNILYAVMYGDYPAKGIIGKSQDELLNNARDGAVNNVQGKILSETIISKEGYPGREFAVKVEPNSVVTAQIVLRNNRIYQVMVVAPSDELFTSKRRQFLDSFEMLK
jgi:hypothetical protein